MPARKHHSIGEVLSLLQDDFPDITISKIRFLESQGLISPERTPSGYRRFFQHDLDRLRWILTQQRDHYLPLKVIREKLAAGEADAVTPAAEGPEAEGGATPDAPGEAGRAAAAEPVAAGAEPAEPVTAEPAGETAVPDSPQATIPVEGGPLPDVEAAEGAPAAAGAEGDHMTDADAAEAEGGAGEVQAESPVAVPADAELGGEGLFATTVPAEGGDQPDAEGTVEVLEASEAVGASEPGEPAPAEAEALDATVGEAAHEPGAGEEPAEAVAEDEAAAAVAEEEVPAPSGRRSASRSRSRRSTGAKAKGQAARAAAAEAGPDEAGDAHDATHDEASPDDVEQPSRAEPDPEEATPAAPAAAEEPTVIALTRDELAEASGCPVPVLNDLERFGLLQGKTVGRGVLYDNDGLVVARLAARFANHGLEPRHLRSFRLAAEREIGLFAQVVGPLLQRRDAMAHERAMETLADLADLASELHEVLVQNLIAREFGNR